METTVRPTPALIFTTTTTPGPIDCIYNNEIYADGALVKKDIPCEHCYCMKGDIVCAVQECGPTPLDKVNCTALPIREGQCCPDTYDCENAIEEEITTMAAEYTTTPATGEISKETTSSESESEAPVPLTTTRYEPTTEEVTSKESASSSAETVQTTAAAVTEYPEVPSRDETVSVEAEEKETTTISAIAETTLKPVHVKEELPKKEDQDFIPDVTPPNQGVPTSKQPETETATPALADREKEAQTTAYPTEQLEEQTVEIVTSQGIEKEGTLVPQEQVTEKASSHEEDKLKEPAPTVPSAPEAETTIAIGQEQLTTLKPREGEEKESATLEGEQETATASLPTIQPGELVHEGLTTALPQKELEAQTELPSAQLTTSATSETKLPVSEEPHEIEHIPPQEGAPEVPTTQQAVVEEETKLPEAEQPSTKETPLPASTSAPEMQPTEEQGSEQPAQETTKYDEQTTPSLAERFPESEKSPESAVPTESAPQATTESELPASETTIAPKEEKLPSKESSTEAVEAETEAAVTSGPERTTLSSVELTTAARVPLESATEEETSETATEVSPVPAHDEGAAEEPIEEGSGAEPEQTQQPIELEKTTASSSSSEEQQPQVTTSRAESATTQAEEIATEGPKEVTTAGKEIIKEQPTQPPVGTTAPVEISTLAEELTPSATEKEYVTSAEHVTELATAESVKPVTQILTTEKLPSSEQEPEATEAPASITTESAIAEEKTQKPVTQETSATESGIEKEAQTQEQTTPVLVTEVPQEKVTAHDVEAEPEKVIPGEGSCLVDGQTYTNNSSVPPINRCQVSCKCVSSILQCESITCAAAPANMQNCVPVYENTDSCCPTYSCSKYY